MAWQCCPSVVLNSSHTKQHIKLMERSGNKHIFVSCNVCLYTTNCGFYVNSWKQIREQFFVFDMHKNSYVSNNSLLYTTNLFCLKQPTKISFICKLLCIRAEIFGNWEIVLNTKLLDFTVLLLSVQTICMRHLCVRGLDSSS